MPSIDRQYDAQGARAAEGKDGYQETAVFVVSGMEGVPHRNWMSEALRTAGLPRMGDPHPSEPGVVVTDRRVNRISGDRALVSVEYRVPSGEEAIDRTQPYGPVTWRGFARSFSEVTREDVNGRRLLVYYQGRPVIETLNLSTGEVSVGTPSVGYYRAATVGEIDVERPLLEIVAERWERDDPEDTARAYQAHTNADTWRRYPAHTVLLREASFEPDPQGGWRVRYSFTVNPKTWRAEVTIQIYNQVPQDATIGNGIEIYDVLPSRSFGPLALT